MASKYDNNLQRIATDGGLLASILNMFKASNHHKPIFGSNASALVETPTAPTLSADEFNALQRMVTGADQPIVIPPTMTPTPPPAPQRTQPQRARRQATPAPAPMVAPVAPVAPAQAAAPIDAFTALQRMVSGADQPAPMASSEPAPVSEADTRYNQLLRMYNILEPTDQFTANQRAVQGTGGSGRINRDEALKYYGGDQEKFEILARLFGW